MNQEAIIKQFMQLYDGLVIRNSWGETGIYYNPKEMLPRGKYVATIKSSDGENDCASQINRKEVDFRLNLKISKMTFLRLFNEPALPERPVKGGVITLKSSQPYDPTILNTVIPHPVYSWMSWICVLNPSKKTFEGMIEAGLINESYLNAVRLYEKAVM